MRNPLLTPRSTDIGFLLVRLPIGVLWVIAGCMKFAMDGGYKGFIDQGKKMLPDWLGHGAGHDFGVYYLHALPFAEIVVGLMIFLGLITRLGGFLSSLIMISILIATKKVWTNGAPDSNVIYLSICLLLFFAGGGAISLDGLFFGKKGGGGGRNYAMN